LKTLCVFDFDETLFRSPKQPKHFKGNWKINKESLADPYVPKQPPDSFWNLKVLNDARKSLKDEESYCILLTGRVGDIFEDRIKELIFQKNLNFDEIHLNNFSSDTVEFKIEKINNVLRRNPSIKNIIFWDDNKEYLKKYKNEYYKNYNVITNLVGLIKIKIK